MCSSNADLYSSNCIFVWGANSALPGLASRLDFGEGKKRGKGRGKGKGGDGMWEKKMKKKGGEERAKGKTGKNR